MLRRMITCLALLALCAGCAGAAQPTPGVIYVTPAPTEEPTPVQTSAPTTSPAATPQPGSYSSLTDKLISDLAGGGATPLPTAAPTPTRAPVRITETALVAACKGKPIPEAAKYAGTSHPLVVVGRAWSEDEPGVSSGSGGYDINSRWFDDAWPGPIQLVVCVDDAEPVRLGSCGTYTRESDGAQGEIVRYRYTQTVRVVVARTGTELQFRSFTGSSPECEANLSLPASGPPPWPMYGDYPSADTIDDYATKVARQKVK